MTDRITALQMCPPRHAQGHCWTSPRAPDSRHGSAGAVALPAENKKPLTPALSPEYRGEGEMSQRHHKSHTAGRASSGTPSTHWHSQWHPQEHGSAGAVALPQTVTQAATAIPTLRHSPDSRSSSLRRSDHPMSRFFADRGSRDWRSSCRNAPHTRLMFPWGACAVLASDNWSAS